MHDSLDKELQMNALALPESFPAVLVHGRRPVPARLQAARSVERRAAVPRRVRGVASSLGEATGGGVVVIPGGGRRGSRVVGARDGVGGGVERGGHGDARAAATHLEREQDIRE